MKCKICGGETATAFEALVLNKHVSEYSLCGRCGFLNIERPYWLAEAYENPINDVDTGILQRNINISEKAAALIPAFFNHKGTFLDFAGGYGLFVRLMRDKGFDFFWQDPYTQNLFARGFEYKAGRPIELLTTFESFEHFADPAAEMEKMLAVSRNILFTTTLLPEPIPPPGDWWYYGLEHGQHISFYSRKSLRLFGEKYGLHFYTNGTYLHLFTSDKISPLAYRFLSRYPVGALFKLFCRDMASRTIPDKDALSSRGADPK